jgi:hypothetical protein
MMPASTRAENDVALRRRPIARSEAEAMITQVKGARLLQGFRGRPAADLAARADTLVSVSYLATHLEGQLAELDIKGSKTFAPEAECPFCEVETNGSSARVDHINCS